jgi:hypothetical protein
VDLCSLSIQMGSKGYIEVENLTEVPIADVKEASRLYLRGSRRRSTAWTNANDASSRSHRYMSYQLTAIYSETSSEPLCIRRSEMENWLLVSHKALKNIISFVCVLN